MFKISTKGDYGLLIMSALAEHARGKNKQFIPLKRVAEEKKLSLKYISQLILPLKRAGLVESKEGAGGGYRLKKNPEDISLLRILEILEGPVAHVRCCENRGAKCGSEPFCNVKSTWTGARDLLSAFLRSKTLADTLYVLNK